MMARFLVYFILCFVFFLFCVEKEKPNACMRHYNVGVLICLVHRLRWVRFGDERVIKF